jgi:MFS family permease
MKPSGTRAHYKVERISSMSANPLLIVARFPRPVRLLLAGTLVNKLGTFIVPYLTLVLLRDFRMAAHDAALLIFAFGSGSLVSILAGGVLTDRLGRRRTLLLSLLGSGALAVLMGLVARPRLFVPLLLGFGFIADLYRPAASAVIGDLLPSSERASGFAGLRMAVNLGWACGTALGGVLADWSWRLLFLGDGLTTLAYGVLVYFTIPETQPAPAASLRSLADTTPGTQREAPSSPRPEAPRPGGRASPFTDPVFLLSVATTFLFTLVFCSHLVVLPLTVTQSAGYPAVVFGMLAALNGTMVALFELTIVERLKRFRRLRLAALGYALAALGFGMIGLVLHWAFFLLAVVVFTLGEILSAPQQMAFVADWAPPEARGRYLSLYQATWSVAFAVNPMLTLPLHAALGERAFWGLAPLVALPGVLLLLHLDRTADRPERLRGLALAAPSAPQ